MTRQGCLALLTILAAGAAATDQAPNEPACPESSCESPGISTTIPVSHSGIPPQAAPSCWTSHEASSTLPRPVCPAPEAQNGPACDACAPCESCEEPCAPPGRVW